MNRNLGWVLLLTFGVSTPGLAVPYTIQSVKGVVEVRHGVEEQWHPLKGGEQLKPDDTIRTGKGAAAVVIVDGKARIRVPDQTIIEIIDLRPIDQQDFILRLTMEFIRAIPSEGRDGGLETPRTTILHGPDLSKSDALPVETEYGPMMIRGAEVLYDNAFYETCVLRTKEVFRVYPELQKQFNSRALVASALEKIGLNREALNEYVTLGEETLSGQEQLQVEKNIARLKKLVE